MDLQEDTLLHDSPPTRLGGSRAKVSTRSYWHWAARREWWRSSRRRKEKREAEMMTKDVGDDLMLFKILSILFSMNCLLPNCARFLPAKKYKKVNNLKSKRLPNYL